MTHLVLSTILGAAGGSVTSTNDGAATLSCELDHTGHQSLGSMREVGKLKHTRGSDTEI